MSKDMIYKILIDNCEPIVGLSTENKKSYLYKFCESATKELLRLKKSKFVSNSFLKAILLKHYLYCSPFKIDFVVYEINQQLTTKIKNKLKIS